MKKIKFLKILFFLIAILLISCEEEFDYGKIVNAVKTLEFSNVTQTTANVSGNIITDNGASLTARGICYGTSNNPTINSPKVVFDTATLGDYTCTLDNLSPSTTYYARAYATNGLGTAYGNVISFTTAILNLTVGQSYQGGTIAYIYVPGDNGYVAGQIHGLIATSTNQSTSVQWGCSGTSIAGTSTTLGAGLANTTAIVNGCSTTTIAARLCNNLVSGGYSDWYLPSRDELRKLYLNRFSVGGFSNVSYWSSSQVGSTTAYSINFSTGASSSASSKTSSLYVRAIRKF
jgi:hypothetical protein